jgi:medium-chain acyl-[acyl-carrier-protein] hydrolase
MANSQGLEWLRRLGGPSDARVRILCLPHAGGGLAEYYQWALEFPDAVEVWGACLPGREERLSASPATDVRVYSKALANALSHAWDDYGNGAYALFGHSFGALLAFELARELRRKGAPVPSLIALSGYGSVHESRASKLSHELSKEDLFGQIRKLWGREFFGAPEMLELIEPTLRADLACCASYRYEVETPLPCNFSLFGGICDPLVERDHIQGWRHLSSGSCSLRMFSGGHFFHISHRRLLLQLLARDLKEAIERASTGETDKISSLARARSVRAGSYSA